jgi:hypothetical protein
MGVKHGRGPVAIVSPYGTNLASRGRRLREPKTVFSVRVSSSLIAALRSSRNFAAQTLPHFQLQNSFVSARERRAGPEISE